MVKLTSELELITSECICSVRTRCLSQVDRREVLQCTGVHDRFAISSTEPLIVSVIYFPCEEDAGALAIPDILVFSQHSYYELVTEL